MALTASELKEKITKLEKGIASPAINEDQKKGLRTALDTYKSQLSKLEASENTEKEETKPASEPEKKKEKSDSAKVGTNKKGAGRPAGSKKKSTENKKEEEKPAQKAEEKPAAKPKEKTESGLTEKECEELLAKTKASRKKAKVRVAKRVAQGLPAAKTVTETVKKTAKVVENKVRQTKVVTARQANSVAKEIVVMVKNVLRGIKVQRERQKFVTDICKNLTTMAKSAKKFEDGGDVSDDESHREGDYPFAEGGNTNQASEQRLFNFLVEDLNKLSKEIENGDKEGIDRFFSYWRGHLEKLNPSKEKIEVEFAKGGEVGDDEIAEIFVEGHPYYISKMGDSTHFKMANSREGANPHGGAAMVSHVGQHSDRSYIDDVKSWLKGGKSPEGKKYANWGLRYGQGGGIGEPQGVEGMMAKGGNVSDKALSNLYTALSDAWDVEPELLIEMGITDEVYKKLENMVVSQSKANNAKYDYSQVVFETEGDMEDIQMEEKEKWDVIHDVVGFDRVKGYTYYGGDEKKMHLSFYEGNKFILELLGAFNNESKTQPVALRVSNSFKEATFNYHPFGSLSGIDSVKFKEDFTNAYNKVKK